MTALFQITIKNAGVRLVYITIPNEAYAAAMEKAMKDADVLNAVKLLGVFSNIQGAVSDDECFELCLGRLGADKVKFSF